MSLIGSLLVLKLTIRFPDLFVGGSRAYSLSLCGVSEADGVEGFVVGEETPADPFRDLDRDGVAHLRLTGSVWTRLGGASEGP